MTREQRAEHLRRAIQMFVQTLDDDQALEVESVFPNYKELVRNGDTKSKGFRFRYQDSLFRVEQPSITFDGLHEPGAVGMESLYSEIPRPTAGTLDDPIAYNNNMELEQGKYYIQNDVIYLCTRNTGVPVYNALADLVGIYVEVYTGGQA